MRSLIVAASALAVVLTLSACGSNDSAGSAQGQPTSTPAATTASSSAPATAPGACDYQATADDPAPQGKDVGLPSAGGAAAKTVVLKTNGGDVTVALSVKAPCTIASFAHLAGKKFYDGSPCHRLTTHDSLKVLQCGDPTGTGRGGPGYTIPDENPTDLPPSPSSANASLYARGTVAMANTGQPHSGGSQFFIVYGDSALPPKYAVFGTVDAAGLATVDKIVAAGLDPSSDPSDGPPKNAVTIQQAVVGS
jgi:cyclophilin family peptidyl-prolyl cis-trans isomerase